MRTSDLSTARVLFAGTPEFALVSLKALVAAGIVPVAVLTQPDRPAGRGKKPASSPVKTYADQQRIPVLQPPTLKNRQIVAQLEALNADLMVVAAYGLILPQAVLDLPRKGCLNVHASLLPRWRGAAPIQAAILAGDTATGISLMAMTAGLDCGPVFATDSIDIGPRETAGELHDRLAALGGELLVDNLAPILDGRIDAVGQEETAASYAPKFKTADAKLDWSLPAGTLLRTVRAYNPTPGAWFMFGDERVKCWLASSSDEVSDDPGAVLGVDDGILIACGDNTALRLERLQRPGKRSVSAREFAAQVELRNVTLG